MATVVQTILHASGAIIGGLIGIAIHVIPLGPRAHMSVCEHTKPTLKRSSMPVIEFTDFSRREAEAEAEIGSQLPE